MCANMSPPGETSFMGLKNSFCVSLNSPSIHTFKSRLCVSVLVFPVSSRSKRHIYSKECVGKLNKDHPHLSGEQASRSQPSALAQRQKDTYTQVGMDVLVYLAPPSFPPSLLRACCAVVERLAGYATSNNGFIYKLHNAAQTNRQETC